MDKCFIVGGFFDVIIGWWFGGINELVIDEDDVIVVLLVFGRFVFGEIWVVWLVKGLGLELVKFFWLVVGGDINNMLVWMGGDGLFFVGLLLGFWDICCFIGVRVGEFGGEIL